MDRGTEHERPAKRAKRDENVSTPPPDNRQSEGHDLEEPDFVSDKNAVQGSDLYLDTV